jgi:hypothetical protein
MAPWSPAKRYTLGTRPARGHGERRAPAVTSILRNRRSTTDGPASRQHFERWGRFLRNRNLATTADRGSRATQRWPDRAHIAPAMEHLLRM